jgi:hypothetical protein
MIFSPVVGVILLLAALTLPLSVQRRAVQRRKPVQTEP